MGGPMKFYKALIGQQYIPGAVLLVLGLLLTLFCGKVQILDPIRKNSWLPVQADLTEVWIVEPRNSRKNTVNTRRTLHWKYIAAEGKQYSGTEIIPVAVPASDPFAVGRSIRVLVNPEKPSESTLFCWNDLTVSARILRVVFCLAGGVIAGLGIFMIVRSPRKKTILVYDCREEGRALFYYAAFPLACLLFFGILSVIICFFDSRLILLVFLSIFVLPFLMVHFARRKTPLLFSVSCPNPDCFSTKISVMRMKALTENACPACGTSLGIPPRNLEKKWKSSEIPDSQLFPRTDSLPLYLFLCWILLIIPLFLLFFPPWDPKTEGERNSGMAFLMGWGICGVLLMPFFMEVSRRWNLRRKKALVCPVCGTCLCERESIETLRQTGRCPACGADVVEKSE